MNNIRSAVELLEQYKVKINQHNFDELIPLLSADCTFWFSSGTYAGLSQARAAFEKTWNLIQNEVYTLSDVQWIAESETAATCVYTYHWAGVINGTATEGKGRGTSCFRKENTGWKIIHEHLSAFPKG